MTLILRLLPVSFLIAGLIQFSVYAAEQPGQKETEPSRQAMRAPEKKNPPAETDLWARIHKGYALVPISRNAEISLAIERYARKTKYLARVARRARPFLHYIVEALAQRGMPMELAMLPVIESAYEPSAYSHAHAAGIWQFIPSTGKVFGLKQNWWYDGRKDIAASTKAALKYLQKLHGEFNGDWLKAIAAYNCGENTVHRAVKRNRKAGKPTDFWSLKLPDETRAYIPALIAVAGIMAKSERYGIELPPIPNKPYLAKVNTGGQIVLSTAAKLARLSRSGLLHLNPGFKRWATNPKGPHYLLVPKAKAGAFKRKLSKLSREERISSLYPKGEAEIQLHTIRPGETLGHIARRYHSSVGVLCEINAISRKTTLRMGKTLMVPSAESIAKHLAAHPPPPLSKGRRMLAQGDPSVREHRIRSGETLGHIAQQYNTTKDVLYELNGITKNTLIRAGKTLVVPIKEQQEQVHNHTSKLSCYDSVIDC
ncbi:MAG: transglycosylase SLT domain-containing protein [Gammaproteobacteria bacterium]|nr:transglycosylase SLT domain-containing protein [Gammaproteobacteria bacterium]